MNKRYNYIDALRGITMMLVVFSHVELTSFGVVYSESLLNSFFVTFRMPLFFFISGFIAYKYCNWSCKNYLQMLRKKSLIQILPTLFFYILFYCICKSEHFNSFFIKGPQGYWFTITLFYMFFIYYTIMYCSDRLSSKWKDYILCFSCIASVLIHYIVEDEILLSNPILCLTNLTRYLQFFIVGVLCRKYFVYFERLISSELVKPFLLLLYLLCFIIAWNKTIIDSYIHILNVEFFVRYLGLFSIFALFYHYKEMFDSNNMIIRGLRFIGRRTLDIYLLHYFFLPDLRGLCPSFLFTPNNIIIEFVVVISIVIVIVLLCLGVSSIIRSSSFLGHYLFGAKINNN